MKAEHQEGNGASGPSPCPITTAQATAQEPKSTFSDDMIDESRDLLRKLEHILHLTQEVARPIMNRFLDVQVPFAQLTCLPKRYFSCFGFSVSCLD